MSELCGIELEHPVINASGTYDAIAARKVFGDELLEDFPFSAFVSKTITPEPRAGNAPQRIWESPAGMRAIFNVPAISAPIIPGFPSCSLANNERRLCRKCTS